MGDVTRWLESLGLGEYREAFAENRIDAGVLPSLTADDLKEIGVAAVGDRRRLLDAIAALSRPTVPKEEGGLPHDVETPPELVHQSTAERRQLTVMFCDLVGSTAISVRFDPEDVAAAIRTYHACCTTVVERWGGHVAKFMGDGVLVYFGWPRAHEDDAERAVRAGLEIVAAVAGLETAIGEPLATRVGIGTGPVMVGELTGEGTSLEQAVVGETPNLAARLQDVAEPGSVVVALGTRQLLGSLFELVDMGQRPLKGFTDPVRAWRVTGEAPMHTRFEALHDRLLTPLVGRDGELMILAKRYRRVEEGEGQVVMVIGEPGIGKSRLCEAFRTSLAGLPHKRLMYQCSPFHTDRAFHPVIAQIEQAADIRPGLDPAARLDRLRSKLGTSPRARENLPVLATLLSIPGDERGPGQDLDATLLAQRLQALITDAFEDTSRDRPLVVVFEDLHWCDPSTLELLGRLVERVERLPVLMLATTRPGIRLAWADQAHVTTLTLNRISRRESAVMLESLTDGGALPEEVLSEILRRGDGIPLFVEEIGRTVIDAHEAGSVPDTTALEVPASLHDSLMSRLDRLASGKQVVQIAAAIGRDFTPETIGRVSDADGEALRTALDELVAAGLLVPRAAGGEPSYTFKHALVQDVAYSSILRRDRKRLHGRIAEVLGDQLADQPALLAHHYECAGAWERALECRRRAGTQAAARSAIWEVSEQYRRVVHALEHLPDTEAHRKDYVDAVLARIEHGNVYRTEQERTEALAHIDRAIALAQGDLAVVARFEAHKGHVTHDEALLASAERHADAVGGEQLQANVAERYANMLGVAGRFEESLAKIERALALYETVGARVELGRFASGPARCYFARAGELARSLHFAEMARHLADTTGDAIVASWLAMESEPCMYRG